ncbi:tannase protein [Taxawa tesnikishii (nom. ined.)]|nr:tannase protein [Dothideales sp. JES 119]
MLKSAALAFIVASAASANYAPSPAHQTTCTNLVKSLKLPNVTVNIVDYVTAGTNLTFSQAGNLSTCNRPSQVVSVDLCRVAMNVATSSRSGITLEAWLPTNWTGRFLSTGNGGLNGCIKYEDMAYAASLGFATVGANNGHNGTSGYAFYNNPDIVTDFAWRSVHTGVVVGKQVSEAYYKKTHTKSYYLGCSTGGRQGFKEVQDFPDDFDGVVAGAPALAFNNLTAWSGHFIDITGTNTSASWEVLNQCDGLDGVKDGIIEDPRLCSFRAAALQCGPGNTTNCLTSAQVLAVSQVFSGYYGVDGSLIYPRVQPGSEIADARTLYSGVPFPYTADWFRYAVYNDPSWNPYNQTVQDAANAYRVNPGNIETWEGDLSAFKNKGGKILHYHGLADSVITSENSPVTTTM